MEFFFLSRNTNHNKTQWKRKEEQILLNKNFTQALSQTQDGCKPKQQPKARFFIAFQTPVSSAKQ